MVVLVRVSIGQVCMTDPSLQYTIQHRTLGQFLTNAPGVILSKCKHVRAVVQVDALTSCSIRELHARSVRGHTFVLYASK